MFSADAVAVVNAEFFNFSRHGIRHDGSILAARNAEIIHAAIPANSETALHIPFYGNLRIDFFAPCDVRHALHHFLRTACHHEVIASAFFHLLNPAGDIMTFKTKGAIVGGWKKTEGCALWAQ